MSGPIQATGPCPHGVVDAICWRCTPASSRPRWRTADDFAVCAVCAELAGAELLDDEAPPHEHCENPNGCRCTREMPGEAIEADLEELTGLTRAERGAADGPAWGETAARAAGLEAIKRADELLELHGAPIVAAGTVAIVEGAGPSFMASGGCMVYRPPGELYVEAIDERTVALELEVSDAELMLHILNSVTGDGFVVLTGEQRAAAVRLLEELER